MRLPVSAVGVVLVSAGACTAQVVLDAHPGPPNFGGPSGNAIFFDLEALRDPVTITELRTANGAEPGRTFTFELLVRDGTGLGGSGSTGPGTSMQGWTWLGTVHGVQGPESEGVSLPVDIPDFTVVPAVVRGVVLWFNTDWGPRFFRNPTAPYWVYQDAGLKLTTGDVRTHPFATIGILVRGAMVGSLTYVVPSHCYSNCDGSTTPPVLNIADFVCFQSAFAAGQPYSNCDQSTGAATLNVLDFVCFMQRFAAGCQ